MIAHQPHYLPAPQYFARMRDAHVFVIRDDVQFRKGDWQNRNRIWLAGKPRWLTIPVTGPHDELICEKHTAHDRWPQKHARLIEQAYPNARSSVLTNALDDLKSDLLLDAAMWSIQFFRERLKIDTPMIMGSEMGICTGDATQDLIEMTLAVGDKTYVCGQHSYHSYLDLDKFRHAGVRVEVYDWQPSQYPDRPTEEQLSVIDVWCRHGEKAVDFLGERK